LKHHEHRLGLENSYRQLDTINYWKSKTVQLISIDNQYA